MTAGAATLDWLTPLAPVIRPLEVPRTAEGRVDLLAMATMGAPLVFESSPETPGTGVWSYAVTGTAGRLLHDGTTATLTGPRGVVDLGPDAFAAIDAVSAALGATPDHPAPADGPPFVGGLAGALAYDLGRLVEDLPRVAAADRDAPWLDVRVVTDLIAVDHRDETAWRVQRPLLSGEAGRDDDTTLVRRLARAASSAPAAVPHPPSGPVHSSLPKDRYLDALAQVLDHIAAGDVFQVNLAQRLTCPWTGGAVDLYRRLRGVSPAPHAALFQRDGRHAIASISPESFLQAWGRTVVTRPIKGTRPRHEDAVADATARDDLLASAKDRAENVMVVDLERNDLGRVCVPGTVRATDLLEPEPHPTVWQLVSTVTGQLRDDVGWGGLLRASFPSGSITGTPKVRAMQFIDHLEPVRRSWYCGSLGWLGPGTASLSVAIRTAVLHDNVVDYAAGGGIVADSDPEAEVDESWTKAAAFLTAVGARHDHQARR